jgi:hypothetical protein
LDLPILDARGCVFDGQGAALRLVLGPLTPAAARVLAAELLAAATAFDKASADADDGAGINE